MVMTWGGASTDSYPHSTRHLQTVPPSQSYPVGNRFSQPTAVGGRRTRHSKPRASKADRLWQAKSTALQAYNYACSQIRFDTPYAGQQEDVARLQQLHGALNTTTAYSAQLQTCNELHRPAQDNSIKMEDKRGESNIFGKWSWPSK